MLDPWFIAKRMLRQNREALDNIMFRFLAYDELGEYVNEAQAQIIFKHYTEFVITATNVKEEDSMRYATLFKGHNTFLQ